MVKEQLEAGHLVPSTSPWNTPIFVMKKKSGKWRLLQDLREVNKTMEIMGALQPGLPSPIAIPSKWHLIIIDLKDCFFTIPLHPNDCKRFAFSIPSINFKEPALRYQWVCLPQGMANSPTLCQMFVTQALLPVRRLYPSCYIIHYMDDILIAAQRKEELLMAYAKLQRDLRKAGLVMAPEKVQIGYPYQYLGYKILKEGVRPQKVQIRVDRLKTLNDYQKLLGDLNWVRPSVGVSSGELKPLFDVLQGDPDPTSERVLSKEAKAALLRFQEALSSTMLQRIDYNQDLWLLVFPSQFAPTALLWQGAPLYWIHLPASPRRIVSGYPTLILQLLLKAEGVSKQYFGLRIRKIILPYTKEQLNYLISNDEGWGMFACYTLAQFDNHYPPDKRVQFFKMHPVCFPKIVYRDPIPNARVVFTDGSSSGMAVVVSDKIVEKVFISSASPQQIELEALCLALDLFTEPLNIFTDSIYVANIIKNLETAPFIDPHSTVAFVLNKTQKLLWQRNNPVYVGHIQSHTGLPGPLSEGNSLADQHTRCALAAEDSSLSAISHAQQLHDKFHLNAQSLKFHTGCTREQALRISSLCPTCAPFIHVPNLGVNPRGLMPNDTWQMDVTHVNSFGKLSFVHVSVDTFSGLIFASAHSGEKAKDVKVHCLAAFAYAGVPRTIKTDNGPAYTSSSVQTFFKDHEVNHKTGIPYNPQGQAIVERCHNTIKSYLEKIKRNEYGITPHNKLSIILYILNFLLVDGDGRSAAERHWRPNKATKEALVRWKDLTSGVWKGPDPVLLRIRGSVCVFPKHADRPLWVPERCVRPVDEPNKGNGAHF